MKIGGGVLLQHLVETAHDAVRHLQVRGFGQGLSDSSQVDSELLVVVIIEAVVCESPVEGAGHGGRVRHFPHKGVRQGEEFRGEFRLVGGTVELLFEQRPKGGIEDFLFGQMAVGGREAGMPSHGAVQLGLLVTEVLPYLADTFAVADFVGK